MINSPKLTVNIGDLKALQRFFKFLRRKQLIENTRYCCWVILICCASKKKNCRPRFQKVKHIKKKAKNESNQYMSINQGTARGLHFYSLKEPREDIFSPPDLLPKSYQKLSKLQINKRTAKYYFNLRIRTTKKLII